MIIRFKNDYKLDYFRMTLYIYIKEKNIFLNSTL